MDKASRVFSLAVLLWTVWTAAIGALSNAACRFFAELGCEGRVCAPKSFFPACADALREGRRKIFSLGMRIRSVVALILILMVPRKCFPWRGSAPTRSRCHLCDDASVCEMRPKPIDAELLHGLHRQSLFVELQPIGRPRKFRRERLLLWLRNPSGWNCRRFCGGVGACGQCKVRLTAGRSPRPLSRERKTRQNSSKSCRLACQACRRATFTLEFRWSLSLPLSAFNSMALTSAFCWTRWSCLLILQ